MRTTPLVRVDEPYDEHGHEVDLDRQRMARRQVGHEHERALQDADEQRSEARVVGADPGAEL